MQISRRDAEGRAAILIRQEEKSGEQSAGARKLGDALRPALPLARRQRAHEGALVDDVERRRAEAEKIRLADEVRKPGERAPRGLERGVGEIDADNIVAM